jgi:hypothetical protein
MAAKPLPSAEYLHQCFDYDPLTGELWWRASRPQEHFKQPSGCATWSKHYAGTIAGTIRQTRNKSRHIIVNLGGNLFYAHRIIWKMTTNRDPKLEVDHINGDGLDNRWTNLRLATGEQNRWNVSWNKQRILPRGVYAQKIRGIPSGNYCAGASYCNRHVYLGTFDTPEEAGAAYRAYVTAERGEFSRTD